VDIKCRRMIGRVSISVTKKPGTHLLLAHFCSDLEQVRNAIEEDYCGQDESIADFAEEIVTENVTIPEPLRYYIDYEAISLDME
jgi:hypothetical protein